MKAQWQSISSDQEERFTAFREHKCQIDKDVSRTDRTHPYFEGDDNPSTKVLQDILMTYIMYNFDLGYVQVVFLVGRCFGTVFPNFREIFKKNFI